MKERMKTIAQLIAVICLSLWVTGCGTTYEQDPVFTDGVGTPSAAGGLTTVADLNRFGPGDLVVVRFSELPSEQQMQPHEERIKDDGTITLPYIGAVKALGKTPGELQKEIQVAYVPKYFKRLTVTVQPFEQFYYVSGQVKGGGKIIYTGDITVTKAIAGAGGFSDFADQKKVRLTRSDKTVLIINCKKIEQDPTQDVSVLPGDQIYVPIRYW